MEKLTAELMKDAVVSTVNLAEVQSKLIKKGFPPEDAWKDVNLLVENVGPFTGEQAKIAGTLIRQTEKLGLSLGDRACLALAISLKAPVYTTEQSWKHLKVGVPVHVIR